MDSADAFAAGLQVIGGLWGRTGEDVSHIPEELRSQIATVLGEDALVSHRYALVAQLLLKVVTPNDDVRSLQGFGDDGFSARNFAKNTVAKFLPVTRRLGNSDDPYVSNPLRKSRLSDDLTFGRGGDKWNALLATIDSVNSNPSYAEPALIHALTLISRLPENQPNPKIEAAAPRVGTNLASLGDKTGIEQNLLLDILDVLESDQPQIILAGPPGTSKTHTAQGLASYLTDGDSSRTATIQLHATYGYEDFVEGLRPVVAPNGNLAFEVHPGILRRVASSVVPGKPEVLILDEMNRANLPRVLGELLFAIERRGEPIDLLYSRGFRLPPELCFIGTMNTADRSIRGIDAAVRRRFMIFELAPSVEVLQVFYESRPNEVSDLFDGFVKLNDHLTQLLDRHHQIGHTFLMDERGMTSGRLNQVWLRQIRPLIEEYLFDLPDELARFTVDAFWSSAVT